MNSCVAGPSLLLCFLSVQMGFFFFRLAHLVRLFRLTPLFQALAFLITFCGSPPTSLQYRDGRKIFEILSDSTFYRLPIVLGFFPLSSHYHVFLSLAYFCLSPSCFVVDLIILVLCFVLRTYYALQGRSSFFFLALSPLFSQPFTGLFERGPPPLLFLLSR